jgi:hypothetical protein
MTRFDTDPTSVRANAAPQHRATDEPSPKGSRPSGSVSAFAQAQYEAFQVSDNRTYALGHISGATIDEALNGVLAGFALFHKQHLVIRETDESGSRLHVYAIKRRSAPNYVYRDHAYHRQDVLYAAPVCAIDNDILQSTREGGLAQAPASNHGN